MVDIDFVRDKVWIHTRYNTDGSKSKKPREGLLITLSNNGAYIESKGDRFFIPMWNIIEIKYDSDGHIQRVF